MSNYFINNRQLVPQLAINTGTTQNPVYSNLCCASEITLNADLETQDFYTFCDALKRYVTTGSEVGFTTTIKLDIQNVAVKELLSKVHALIKNGTVAQFTNVAIEFQLLSGLEDSTLVYTTYTATANLAVSDLGGSAEDVSEFNLELKLNGTATEVSASM